MSYYFYKDSMAKSPANTQHPWNFADTLHSGRGGWMVCDDVGTLH